jgi:hypothetical protein
LELEHFLHRYTPAVDGEEQLSLIESCLQNEPTGHGFDYAGDSIRRRFLRIQKKRFELITVDDRLYLADESSAKQNSGQQAQSFGVNSWLIAVSVMLATFMEVLGTAIASVALPYIAGSLSASNDEATWVLTSSALPTARTTGSSLGICRCLSMDVTALLRFHSPGLALPQGESRWCTGRCTLIKSIGCILPSYCS